MIYTVQNMLKKIRWETNHDEFEFSGSSELEMMYVCDAMDKVFDDITAIRPEILSNYFDITLDGSLEYYIPTYSGGYFDYDQILMVEDRTSSNSPLPTISSNWADRMQYLDGVTSNTSRIVYSIRDNYIETPNKESTGTLRVWYTRRPSAPIYGTVSSATSTTLVLPETLTGGELRLEDKYYNGNKVWAANQIRTVSDYAYATRILTVSSAWSTIPTGTDTFSTLPALPERLNKLIVLEAIYAIKISQEDDGRDILTAIEREQNTLYKKLRKRSRQTAWRPRQVPR